MAEIFSNNQCLNRLLAAGPGIAGATTTANGADVTQGAIADASVAAGATGSISAKLRRISADIGSLLSGGAPRKQYTGVPSGVTSGFTIQTADQTVFTLAAGEIGFIQVLSTDAPLAVKLGASASTTSLNFIVNKAASANGGSEILRIDFWVGAVSVAKMAGTSSYLAWKIAP